MSTQRGFSSRTPPPPATAPSTTPAQRFSRTHRPTPAAADIINADIGEVSFDDLVHGR